MVDKINKIQIINDTIYNIISELDTCIHINEDTSVNINSIEGEILSIKPSGKNQYITIKNGDYQISCISWGNIYDSKEGDIVEIIGKLSILKKNLSLYFNIKKLQKIGTGNYAQSFVELKNKIINLGWCNNKREINNFPYNIGIISSLEGAAIQDIFQTFKLDKLNGNVFVKNAIVQGKQCPSSVIEGIKYFNETEIKVDLLLITRGGGSNEDLIGFSDFKLLEEIHNSNIITISAVGHQIDNQLSDIVADYYFATPSIAAKFIVEKQKIFIEEILNIKEKINNILLKYQEDKEKIINFNVDLAITNYEKIELNSKLNIYKNVINDILQKYNNSKITFYNNISKIKPTMFIEGTFGNNEIEINSVENLINSKAKKMQIIFHDGMVIINYKINSFEKY